VKYSESYLKHRKRRILQNAPLAATQKMDLKTCNVKEFSCLHHKNEMGSM